MSGPAHKRQRLDSAPDEDDESDFEALVAEAEREAQSAQDAREFPAVAAGLQQQQLSLPARDFAFLQSVTSGVGQRVIVTSGAYMPSIRGTKVSYKQPDSDSAVEISIEPRPSTPLSAGNIVVFVEEPWLGESLLSWIETSRLVEWPMAYGAP
eukprot:1877096-Prymnesium_polylepis.1